MDKYYHTQTGGIVSPVSITLKDAFTQAVNNNYSFVQLLLDLKQNLIDEEDYEALIPFRDLEEEFDFPIPFIMRG